MGGATTEHAGGWSHHGACWWEWSMLVGGATTEHAGGSGVQLSVGAEMQARGDYPIFLRNLKTYLWLSKLFSPFFCANNYYTSLLLIVCALR